MKWTKRNPQTFSPQLYYTANPSQKGIEMNLEFNKCGDGHKFSF